MSFKMNCPHCGQPVSAEDEMVGQTFPCPNCSGDFVVTHPGPAPQGEPVPVPGPQKTGWRHNRHLNLFAGVVLAAILGAKLLGLLGGADKGGDSQEPTKRGNLAYEGEKSLRRPRGEGAVDETLEQDPALKLGLARHGSVNFMDMRKSYGFRGGRYEMLDPSGGLIEGSYRDKQMVLVADWGLYEVSTKLADGIALQQHWKIRGKLPSLPPEVLLMAPALMEKPIGERDQVSFVGIQVECMDLGTYIPRVRVLGLWNMTTDEFYNFENPASRLEDVEDSPGSH